MNMQHTRSMQIPVAGTYKQHATHLPGAQNSSEFAASPKCWISCNLLIICSFSVLRKFMEVRNSGSEFSA